jgi:UDP-N-acetylmuramoyl-L-alanyl-D-glutamate--2,6-diaminopimelate ligase
MKWSQLLSSIPGAPLEVPADPDITGLAYDSRRVQPGDLFFALPGMHTDGARYLSDALAAGATAVIAGHNPNIPVPYYQTADVRATMGLIAAEFFGHPSSAMRVAGITGTNGKTTTTFLLRHLMHASRKMCGLIGTILYDLGNTETPASRTTPESIDLQGFFANMVKAGCSTCAMEVSSHALVQKRTSGTRFRTAVFTNLTQDHLDYHGSMEEYFEAKALLFEATAASGDGRGVINSDDRFGTRLIERYQKKMSLATFGLGVRSDFRASNIHIHPRGTEFRLEARGKEYLVRTPLIGNFNVLNTLAAIATAASLGAGIRDSVQAMANAPQIPGRLQRVAVQKNYQVFVDYAHTDDALANVLKTLRELRPSRLICVFGCGGDRDRAKRPKMGSVAGSLSDLAIVTTDNPRSEDPDQIIQEILAGMNGSNPTVIPDRAEAIQSAIGFAREGDVILIAGKGHENYQEIQQERHPFDDVRCAAAAMRAQRSLE